jgi:hypothetical protein
MRPNDQLPAVATGWPARRAVIAIAAALIVGLLGGAALVRPLAKSATAPVSQFVFVGQTLQAITDAGDLLWSHDFGTQVAEVYSLGGANQPLTDLDGDGSPEAIVPVQFGPRGRRASTSDELVVFGADGRKLWTVKAPESLRCSNDVFTGPWHIYAVAVSDQPGPKKVWVAFNHNTWCPSFVVELGADGQQLIRYAQTGWIRSLTSWKTPTGSYLVAGGVTNEDERPILTVVDGSGPPTMNPSINPRFNCEGLPTARPRAVFLLPNDEIGTVQGLPYAMVDRVQPIGNSLKVTPAAYAGTQLLEISPALRIVDFSFADSYWPAHRQLEQQGKILHSATACPQRLKRPIRSWTPLTGWQDLIITPTIRGNALQ